MTRQSAYGWLLGSVLALSAVLAVSARAPAPRAPVLRPAYAVRLTSAWPRYAGESETCNNRGSEVLEGTLTRMNGLQYAGRLARRSRLGFCGAHGNAQPRSCGLQLAGSGNVEVDAAVFDAGSGPELRLAWTPVPDEARVRVEGTCSRDFEQAMESLYISAVHHAEIPISSEVLGQGAVPIPDYGWVVEVE